MAMAAGCVKTAGRLGQDIDGPQHGAGKHHGQQNGDHAEGQHHVDDALPQWRSQCHHGIQGLYQPGDDEIIPVAATDG
jgi:hypothetical protein